MQVSKHPVSPLQAETAFVKTSKSLGVCGLHLGLRNNQFKFKTLRKLTITPGIHGVYLTLKNKNGKITTCNRSGLDTLEFSLIMPKILHGHYFCEVIKDKSTLNQEVKVFGMHVAYVWTKILYF